MHSLLAIVFLVCTSLASHVNAGGMLRKLYPKTEGLGENCIVNGTEIEDTEIKYIIGEELQEGSIYAKCYNGTAKCFTEDGTADKEDVPYNCTDINFADAHRRLGVTYDGTRRLWPKGVMCYRPLGAEFSARQRALFDEAIRHVKNGTKIDVITTTMCQQRADRASICGNCANFVRVFKDSGCYSKLGYTAQPNQDLSLTNGCFRNGFGTCAHEILHAFGVFHEHTHPNRSVVVLRSQLSVSPSNYETNFRANFSRYDPHSIMHYPLGRGLCIPKESPEKYCDVNEESQTQGCKVATPLDCYSSEGTNSVGQRTHLSKGDYRTLNDLYFPVTG